MTSRNSAISGSRKTILQLIDNLKAGHTFTDSMAQAQGWLSEFDMAILSVGEQSGRLDVSFRLLSNFCGARAKIFRDTISGLISTLATLHVFLLIFPLTLLISFVVDGIFGGHSAACVPFIIEKVLVFGGLYGLVLFFIFASHGRRGIRWRSLVESMFHCVPILRSALRFLALSRLAAALEALTNAGVNVTHAWELAATAAGSPALKQEISGWKPQIEAGRTPAELVNQARYFPELFANLYQTGEVSGKLDETLNRLHVYYQEEGFRALRLFTRILNGVIYGGVVAVVAYNIIKFWTNYYATALNV
jgi:type II secretory pathway component PulF